MLRTFVFSMQTMQKGPVWKWSLIRFRIWPRTYTCMEDILFFPPFFFWNKLHSVTFRWTLSHLFTHISKTGWTGPHVYMCMEEKCLFFFFFLFPFFFLFAPLGAFRKTLSYGCKHVRIEKSAIFIVSGDWGKVSSIPYWNMEHAHANMCTHAHSHTHKRTHAHTTSTDVILYLWNFSWVWWRSCICVNIYLQMRFCEDQRVMWSGGDDGWEHLDMAWQFVEPPTDAASRYRCRHLVLPRGEHGGGGGGGGRGGEGAMDVDMAGRALVVQHGQGRCYPSTYYNKNMSLHHICIY